ncbi:MAG: SUMF1/EgtB/PvdO family nonheme iron enzyme [Bacteroidaceae bacterium]|nr:SUMF1/EgtB/PvdO family nonheme iron enzyme [Bacteroidaceae bacterium]
MDDKSTGKFYAVKCFTEDHENRDIAYRQICAKIEKLSSHYFTNALYIENEFSVGNNNTTDTKLPVLFMDWVEGDTMTMYVTKHYKDKQLMSKLCENFLSMASWLRIQNFAHGDITPDNIIVKTDGSLALVDYDCMYVPAMNGQKSPNLGTSAFRHPRRTIDDFDRTIDVFALSSIAVSLKAIALKPSIFEDYGVPGSLIFSEKDYNEPDKSKILKKLTTLLNEQEFCRLFGEFLIVLSYKNSSNSISMGQQPINVNPLTFTVKGVSFEMVNVEGGTFDMGSNDPDAAFDAKSVHSVTLSDYSIGKTVVTQALWQVVMGNNPSNFKGDNLPIEKVSWCDCQEFIRKLNVLTGKTFRLPTEAEWEFAAKGGNKSKGYKYSGSDNIDNVAWYKDNSGNTTHPVATKQPNELGIYDMSGNVWEWCSDWYGNYDSCSQRNPNGPDSGFFFRVSRGGGWSYETGSCGVSNRDGSDPSDRGNELGLRLVLSNEKSLVTESAVKKDIVITSPVAKSVEKVEHVSRTARTFAPLKFNVNGVSFEMIIVDGGTFQMGSNDPNAYNDEKPVHTETVSIFGIGKTQVTQELWEAVMGSKPRNFESKKCPVYSVYWDDCNEFIRKLNNLTGKKFRFPTEAEWEFAARGGNLSKGYKYSGSDNVEEVAWYCPYASGPAPVAWKKPNELGIYDMSGNVFEWCAERDRYYGHKYRGGCWGLGPKDCRSTSRGHNSYGFIEYHGLRLALDLD